MNQVVSANVPVAAASGTTAPKKELNLFSASALSPAEITQYTHTELSVFATKFTETYDLMHDHPNAGDVLFFGETYADISGQSHASRMARLRDYEYVYGRLLQMHEVRWECLRMSARTETGERKYSYSSDFAQKAVGDKLKKQADYAKRCGLTNLRTGGSFSMSVLVEAKGKARKAEMYALVKDTERCAQDMGYRWMFFTLTAPGRYHIAPETKNPTEYWDKSLTPNDSARFIQTIWARGSDDFRRDGIEYFGCWSKEPHGSAAVHMHALIFANPSDHDKIEERIVNASRNAFEGVGAEFIQSVAVDVVRQKTDAELEAEYESALAKYKAARAAGNSKAKRPKRQKAANPASYIFKYILKAINDVESDNGIEFAGAQRAHAKYHRYKRFSFLGIKQCLGKWRMIKALMRNPDHEKDASPAFDAVRNNQFMAFADMVDDIEYIKEDAGTGQYGDDVVRIVGIRYGGRTYKTDEYLLGIKMGDDGVVYPECRVEWL